MSIILITGGFSGSPPVSVLSATVMGKFLCPAKTITNDLTV
jgi:hypothetical protein